MHHFIPTYTYAHQTMQVKRGGVVSALFNVINGVRQGGIMAPILFSMYMDDLLNQLNVCFIQNSLIIFCSLMTVQFLVVQVCSNYCRCAHSVAKIMTLNLMWKRVMSW